MFISELLYATARHSFDLRLTMSTSWQGCSVAVADLIAKAPVSSDMHHITMKEEELVACHHMESAAISEILNMERVLRDELRQRQRIMQETVARIDYQTKEAKKFAIACMRTEIRQFERMTDAIATFLRKHVVARRSIEYYLCLRYNRFRQSTRYKSIRDD